MTDEASLTDFISESEGTADSMINELTTEEEEKSIFSKKKLQNDFINLKWH